MLLHQDNKFIYNLAAAIKLPNNIYLDPCPDACPIEGMVFYSQDQRARAEINFVETEADARAFLEEEGECYESFQCLKPIAAISTNGVNGFTMTFATTYHIYEEYAFSLPGNEPTLLNICIEQQKSKPADVLQCAQLVAELLAGITLLYPC